MFFSAYFNLLILVILCILSKLVVVCDYVVMFIFILVLVKYIKLNYMEMKNFADL